MWEAWKLSQSYHKLPSEIYRLTDPVTGWCFDRAVWVFGSTVENELEAAARKAKRPQQAVFYQQSILRQYGIIKEMQFADPGTKVKGKQDSQPTKADVSSGSAGLVQL